MRSALRAFRSPPPPPAARGPCPPSEAPASCGRLAAPAEHLEADLLLGDVGAVLADDLTLVDDEDPVGEREDLVELERDEQDRAPFVTLLDEPPVQELDRADVEPSRRLCGDQHLRVARDLAPLRRPPLGCRRRPRRHP